MMAEADKTECHLSASTYTNVIIACARAHRPLEAESAVQSLESHGPNCADISAYSALMSAWATVGRWEAALRTLGRMRAAKLEPNVVTWTALVTACGKGGRPDIGEEVMTQMRGVGCEPNVVTWTALINGYAKRGEWEEAERVWEEMCAQGGLPNEV